MYCQTPPPDVHFYSVSWDEGAYRETVRFCEHTFFSLVERETNMKTCLLGVQISGHLIPTWGRKVGGPTPSGALGNRALFSLVLKRNPKRNGSQPSGRFASLRAMWSHGRPPAVHFYASSPSGSATRFMPKAQNHLVIILGIRGNHMVKRSTPFVSQGQAVHGAGRSLDITAQRSPSGGGRMFEKQREPRRKGTR